MNTATAVSLLLALLVAAGLCLAAYAAGYRTGIRRPAGPPAPDPTRVAHEAELRTHLQHLQGQLRELEHQRVASTSQLREQVGDLRRETRGLATALRRPQVRGRWGELHLRRTVELAGMVEHCDFTEQVQLADGAQRPDLVVQLAGGRQVVVDAKVPLDAYLDATSPDLDDLDSAGHDRAADGTDADAEEERLAHLRRHARQLRTHIDALGAKSYWRQFSEAPEFVVLFVPAESVLAAALHTDPALLEHAATRRVVLASPSTLIALLRTVAHGWSHLALSQQAAEVHRLGRELHARLRTWGGHLDAVGRSLNTAVGAYNAAVGSLESRVLVSARRFDELGVTGEELPTPRSVELHALERPSEADAAPRRGSTSAEPSDRRLAL